MIYLTLLAQSGIEYCGSPFG